MIAARNLRLLRLGLRNLAGYPLRTFLTTLGVVCGVASVIAMMAMGAGAERELLRTIGRLGIENIILNSVKPPEKPRATEAQSWFIRYGLTYKDQDLIEETVPGLRRVLPVHKRRRTVWWGSRKVEATVYAVRPVHLRLFGLSVVRGRPLCALDGASLRRVCVVRSGLLKALGAFVDPVGRSLQVGDEYYRIVGVLPEEEFLGYAQKALAIDSKTTEVYVPYETVRHRQGTRTVTRRQGSIEATNIELSQLVVSVQDVDRVVGAARMLRRILDHNHTEQDFDMVVPLEVLRQRRETQRIFNFALVLIASISLLVGGIGIANIMLATVTERTREIGIRRALGAKRRHILAQFLTETTAISALGGVVGVAVGFLFSYVLSSFTGWEAVVTPGIVVLAFSISVGVGILSGIFPARRAALLDPIAALRHE